MSTHLEHGYLITGRDPFDLVADLTSTLPPVAKDLFVTWVAQAATEHIDRQRFGVTDPDDMPRPAGRPLWKAHLAYVREQVTDAHLSARRSEHDLDVSVTLTRHPRLPGQMLALLFTGQRALREAFATIAGVEPYPYWSHTDRPADVLAEQWEQRRTDWDAAFGHGVPASTGLSWTAEPNPRMCGYSMDAEAVLAAVPDVTWRAERLAQARTYLLPSTRAAMKDLPLAEQIDKIHEDLPALAAHRDADAAVLLPQLAPVTLADLTQVL